MLSRQSQPLHVVVLLLVPRDTTLSHMNVTLPLPMRVRIKFKSSSRSSPFPYSFPSASHPFLNLPFLHDNKNTWVSHHPFCLDQHTTGLAETRRWAQPTPNWHSKRVSFDSSRKGYVLPLSVPFEVPARLLYVHTRTYTQTSQRERKTVHT